MKFKFVGNPSGLKCGNSVSKKIAERGFYPMHFRPVQNLTAKNCNAGEQCVGRLLENVAKNDYGRHQAATTESDVIFHRAK